MIHILLISHSLRLVEGIRELILSIVPDVSISIVGGIDENRLGTEPLQILDALNKLDGDVLIFFDVGSALINFRIAKDLLQKEMRLHLIDAPIVEGALLAATDILLENSIEEILVHLESMNINKIAK